MSCRICRAPTRQILDLGESPPANSLKSSPDQFQESYPLVLEWCESCDNVQLRDTLSAENLYRDYLYVTPDSTSLDSHYESLLAYLKERGYLDRNSSVVEAGSNVGHFLHHVAPSARSVLGVDPARDIVQMANELGVPTICDFFSPDRAAVIARESGPADLIVARHCLAHNESPHTMLAAARSLVAENGCLLIENAYVLNTIENTEFDQVYHEHMFYFSVRSMKVLLAMHDMELVDAFTAPVHGGSIIFIAQPVGGREVSAAVAMLDDRERQALNPASFGRFGERVAGIRTELRSLITDLKARGASVYSYGATAKGNTLMNYVGLTSADISLCVDSTPVKQGRFLPGSSIRVISEEEAAKQPPDFFLLTAWNYKDEIIAKVRESGNTTSRFILAVPSVQVV
jgi:SAM-dependent methyltransferase